MGSVTRYLPIFPEAGHGGRERREESTVSSMPSNFLFQFNERCLAGGSLIKCFFAVRDFVFRFVIDILKEKGIVNFYIFNRISLTLNDKTSVFLL